VNKGEIRKLLSRLSACALIGTSVGLATSFFLIALHQVTQWRKSYALLILSLPLGGWLVLKLYQLLSPRSHGGTNFIFEEIHEPKNPLPKALGPLVFLGTLLTHLGGGSAGREGVAAQLGSSLADHLGPWLKNMYSDRRRLLTLGMAAGFGSALGTPWAGAFFASEALVVGRWQAPLWDSVLCSWVAYSITLLLPVPHTHYPHIPALSPSLAIVVGVIGAALSFGGLARFFVHSTHILEGWLKKIPLASERKIIIGGSLIAGLFYLLPDWRIYAGLGLDTIEQAFHSTIQSPWIPWLKSLFTSATLSLGYKGGEFTPLVFIGSTWGSFLSAWLEPQDPAFWAALGFATTFSAAANTPVAGAIMAAELFGWPLLPWALLSGGIAHLITPMTGIYKTQKVLRPKWAHRWLREWRQGRQSKTRKSPPVT